MYTLYFSQQVKKSLKKLDAQTQRLVKNWINKHLQGVIDPRIYGKALTGDLKGFWRYRIGDYRLIAKIEDKKLLIFLVELEHRSTVYR